MTTSIVNGGAVIDGAGGGGASLPTTPALALLDAANQGNLVALAPSTGVGTSLPIQDAVSTGLGILTESADEGDFLVGDGAGATQLASAAASAVRAVIGVSGTAREGTLAARGTASDYQGGTYLVTSGASSIWSLWQSVLISGAWTWVRRVYHLPSDTLTSSGVLADWDFSALTTADTTCPNAANLGTGTLSIGSAQRARLAYGIPDASWLATGLQSIALIETSPGIPGAVTDVTASGTLFEPTGDWTLWAWVARQHAPLFNTANGCIAVMKRRDDSAWGGPSNFSSVNLGVGATLAAQGYIAQGGGPTFTTIDGVKPLVPGRLTLLALVYIASTGTLNLYQDTELVATTTGLGAVSWGAGASRSWCVGGNSSAGSPGLRQEFPGWIGRVGFASVAATPADIARHVAVVSGRP